MPHAPWGKEKETLLLLRFVLLFLLVFVALGLLGGACLGGLRFLGLLLFGFGLLQSGHFLSGLAAVLRNLDLFALELTHGLLQLPM